MLNYQLMETVSQESFATLDSIWASSKLTLDWSLVFTLPPWLEVWWRHFHRDSRLCLASFKDGDGITGIAPLQVRQGAASFVGDPDVCDFEDFIVAPGRHSPFFSALLRELEMEGIHRLDLGHVRPDSTVLAHLVKAAESAGWQASAQASATSVEMDLPPTFDGYLETLNGKQRHEVRRKLRRFEEMGKIRYRGIADRAEIEGTMPVFFKYFTESRSDKATFMTPAMAAFFRDMASAMAGINVLRLGALDLDGPATAMVLYFDYRGVRYLYNSGYDPAYGDLSAGLISKVYCIRDAIERGMKRFDFLKGAEAYKHYLGGKEVSLYTCKITKEARCAR